MPQDDSHALCRCAMTAQMFFFYIFGRNINDSHYYFYYVYVLIDVLSFALMIQIYTCTTECGVHIGGKANHASYGGRTTGPDGTTKVQVGTTFCIVDWFSYFSLHLFPHSVSLLKLIQVSSIFFYPTLNLPW